MQFGLAKFWAIKHSPYRSKQKLGPVEDLDTKWRHSIDSVLYRFFQTYSIPKWFISSGHPTLEFSELAGRTPSRIPIQVASPDMLTLALPSE